ncbi:benzoate 4-monooxygenase cytochrome P450 [Coprinopsis cinerea okayama7|uniref:Benzoate 4-monooxygenase cytochrome P450 n=1 Tax=Coprinopsis cinerea (strain Okayama-7 / 130 / ATCC MYA-4618 / FGSC 9003) TaxID=240176 RepID=A8NY75_COPC7|nr:benzoate 4-monooxygenase cytochrome P450 [Coprinopsis cinerea okayama7\|eukprot:XP_001837362.2 benzoate 4-monooxygenase cytochrome P450 [Coprinopsis cinerea okayama7\
MTAMIGTLLSLSLLGALWFLYVVVRRLVFHPLARLPGPPLAAITGHYKTYFDVVRGGHWLRQLDRLHNKYGSVIRVGPNELHFKDRQVYDRIFSPNNHFTKDQGFYSCFGVGSSTFGATDPIHAKANRDLLAPYFDKRAMLDLESVISSTVELLGTRLTNREAPIDMFYGFRCATMDIITTHCFGRSSQLLQMPDLRTPLLVDIQDSIPLLWSMKSFPWLPVVLPWLPPWIGTGPKRQYDAFMRLHEFVSQEIAHVAKQGCGQGPKGGIPRCIYQDLITVSPLVHGKRSHTYLVDEALSLIQAGSDTIANTCIIGFFHVLNNPSIHARLTTELIRAFPDSQGPFAWSDLQKVSYLTAVIKESLRLSNGFVSPLPRVVGKDGVGLNGVDIPPGTVVSVGPSFIHSDPEIFPRPEEFCPERWLGASPSQNRYLIPFSRGPRMCLGINMAWTELYLTFGILFRKLDMVITHGPSPKEMADFVDYFVPVYGGKHLHIQAKLKDP